MSSETFCLEKKQRSFSFNPHDQPAHTNVFYQVIKVTCYIYEGMKKYRKKHKINHLRTMMAVTQSPIQNSRLSQNSIANLLLFSSYLKKAFAENREGMGRHIAAHHVVLQFTSGGDATHTNRRPEAKLV